MQLVATCQAPFHNHRVQADIQSEFPVELVVARCREELKWLRRVPASVRITIYNKGEDPGLPPAIAVRSGLLLTELHNQGREAHSYLTHLCHRYESLSPVTVFCQGHPFDHAPDFHDRLGALVNGTELPDPFLWYGFLEETDDPCGRRLFVPWSKNHDGRELSTGRLYEELFGNAAPSWFHFRGGAQFAVTAGGVRRRSREFYERALALSTENADAAHSLERFWDRFFGLPVIDPASLGPDGVRYLKKIRRLETTDQGC
jgi:hypothetical protein